MPPGEEWFKSKVAPTRAALEAGDGCHAGEAKSLADYLAGKLTAPEAAAAFTAPVLAEHDPPASLYRPMALLCDALVDFGHDRDKLLDLLAAIQSLPPSPQVDWSTLPGFGNMWSDLYRLYTHGADHWEKTDFPFSDARKAELRQHFETIATVETELYLRGLDGVSALWGYDALRLITSRRVGLEVIISSMHVWLTRAGTKLKQDLDPEKVATYGKDATMAEHWETWKQTFLLVSEEENFLSAEARKLAAECYELMQ